MHIVEGVLALFAAIALYGWAHAMHHRPDAPDWARGQLFASVISLVLVCVAPVGAGLVALGLGEPMSPLSWAGLAVLALTPLLLWRVLR